MRLSSAFAGATALACITGLAGAASAQDTEFSFNAAVVSDYVFRGFSQSDEGPAFQAGVDLTSGAFYVGAWASSVDFGDSTDVETNFYVGVANTVGGFDLDFGVIGYFYAGEPTGSDYDMMEVKAAISRAFGPVTAGFTVNYSPDFYGPDGEATYLEFGGEFEAAPKLTISAAVGQQWLDISDDYVSWNLGATYALTDKFGVDVRYHGSDVDGPLSDDRVVLSLTAAF